MRRWPREQDWSQSSKQLYFVIEDQLSQNATWLVARRNKHLKENYHLVKEESGRIQALLNQEFLAGLKNHSQWKWKEKKPRRWRVHQLDNKSNASNSVWYTSSAYSAWTPSVRFTLSLPARLGHDNLNNSQTLPQFDSESPCSESKGASHPCFSHSEGGGKERPRGEGEPGVSGL